MRRCLSCQAEAADDRARCPQCGTTIPRVRGFLSYAPEFAITDAGFDPGLFAHLAALEDQSFWFRARNDLICWAMAREKSSPGSILEIGCGTGFVLAALRRRFPNARLVGSEIHVEGLMFARERLPSAELLQMDARQMPFREEFDVVCAFDVLEHIETDVDVLDEMFRTLKPGGTLVVTVPQHRWLWSKADEHAHHVRRYKAPELDKKVRAAGFAIVRSTSFVSLLLPLLGLSRALSRVGGAPYDPAREMQLPQAVNSVLRRVMALEFILIRAGARLPAGGSRLIVASRPMEGATDEAP